MSDNGHGPCLDSWVPDATCCSSIPAAADRDADENALYDRLRAVAAEVLWRASGRRYGLCEYVVRPCEQPCQESTFAGRPGGAPWTPYSDAGVWKNCTSGSCGSGSCGSCDCCSLGCREVHLPGPVHDVTQVRIGGVVVDPREYRVDDHRKLVRVGKVTQQPTDASIGITLTGAGLNGPDFPRYCDVTPTPDSTTGFDPLSGGCYQVASSTQTLGWTASRDVSIRYEQRDAPDGSRVLTVNNAADPSEQYQFPDTLLSAVGDSMVSTTRPSDDTYARITKTGGAGTIQREGNPLELTGDVTFRVEILRETFEHEPECWPSCSNLAIDAGQPDTFEVTYRVGIPIGALGEYALGIYLCELWKLCNGERCALPARVEGVFRQGINIDFADDNLDLLSGMRTGIPQVDTWLALVNPDKIRQASQVYSPDRPRTRTQTWPGR